ncbi:MAG: TIR domain-containing protein [Caldilineaceae bacterium]
MKLTGPQIQQLHTALLDAFRTRSALEQMVRFALNENLSANAADLSDLRASVFDLINWAEAHGRLRELVDGARQQNPGNDPLRQCATNLFPPDAPIGTPISANRLPFPSAATRRGAGGEVHQFFQYDVFLSHSSADKAVVRALAERLRADGLRVWLDEWIIQPGDMIGLKIEEGLQQSRALILCMSQNAFDSDWVKLERHTMLFRDPTNSQRRFIPLRLDGCDLPDMIAQFAYVDWRTPDDQAYAKLHRACTPPAAPQQSADDMTVTSEDNSHRESPSSNPTPPIPAPIAATSPPSPSAAARRGAGGEVNELPMILDDPLVLGFGPINSLAVTPDGRYLIGGSADSTVKVWERGSGRRVATLEGHGASVFMWRTPDGAQIISGPTTARQRERAGAAAEGHGARSGAWR